jgi:putative CocE/NonD family hydrolase
MILSAKQMKPRIRNVIVRTSMVSVLLPVLVAMLLASIGCRYERAAYVAPLGASERSRGFADYPNIIVERNVPVPMRDGVVLRADVYRPDDDGRFATLVYRTPYGKDDLLDDWELTLSRAPRSGYAVVVQDVRGRYNSDGRFQAYHQEGKDGYDTIEWAAGQSWSNGRIGTFGLSYPGAVQWLAAMEAPPHLAAIFPAMTFASGRHFFHYGGAFNHTWIRWIEVNIAPDERRRSDLPGPRTYREARTRWEEHKWEWEEFLPIVDFQLLKEVAPWYYDWLRHPDDGGYWSFADVTAAHDRITVPALNFSAWYDDNYGPIGATANFNGMRERAATEEARRGQKLILGPWTHGDPNESETRFGELDFGVNATFDYFGLILRWHDRWLKGIRNGVDGWAPVQIFVMGENVWRDEQEWPLARTRYVPYYVRSDGSANTAGGDGRLSLEPPPGGEPPDLYTYDPGDPVVIENFESAGPFDHSVIQQRDDVLVYTSDPLDSDVEVTGPVTAHLWIASSAVDTDFGVTLLDVHPDGKAFNLMPLEAGFIRTRYRDSEEKPIFLTPDEPTEIVVSGMVTSNLFLKGHRRVLVSSSRFPVFDRNLNTGEPPGASSRMIPAKQTILHDTAHPSRVILPIVPRDGMSGE